MQMGSFDYLSLSIMSKNIFFEKSNFTEFLKYNFLSDVQNIDGTNAIVS